MVCVGLSERDLKNFGGVTGGARQNFGGAVATPDTPLAPPLFICISHYHRRTGRHFTGERKNLP